MTKTGFSGSVWLEKRPSAGIWGGLYCLPVFDSDEALHAALPDSLSGSLQALPHFVHVLTHKDLHLAPWMARFGADQAFCLQASFLSGVANAGDLRHCESPCRPMPARHSRCR